MNLVEISDLSISFPGVKALDSISFNIEKGDTVALCGENGAGKSTLGKILAGVHSHRRYQGAVEYKGERLKLKLPIDAENIGIYLVHQELALIREMTVAENIYLSHFPTKYGVVDRKAMTEGAKVVLAEFGLDIDPETKIKKLTVAMQQMVEIAKALSGNGELIIFDESTSALTSREIDDLFEIMRGLKSRGVTSIFITHKLDEIFEICDSATVLKDARLVNANVRLDSITKDDVIRMMIGRELKDMYPNRPEFPPGGKKVFEVQNWNLFDSEIEDRKIVDDFSFHIREGEIVGMYGLVGAGRTEFVNSVFEGKTPHCDGRIFVHGEEIRIKSTADAVANGISLITEDRKGSGLFLQLSVSENLSIASLRSLTNWMKVIDDVQQKKINADMIRKMEIKVSSPQQAVNKLSGGNQQKVVIGKWLMTNPKVLILDEPTKGIDVGTKAEVYKMLRKLTDNGIGVLIVSSELPEVLGVADRIIVVREGKNVAEVQSSEAKEEDLLKKAMGRN